MKVLDPAGDNGFVRQLIGVLEIKQSHRPVVEERTTPFPLQRFPADQRRQLMVQINHVDKARAEKVILFRRASAVLQGQTDLAGL